MYVPFHERNGAKCLRGEGGANWLFISSVFPVIVSEDCFLQSVFFICCFISEKSFFKLYIFLALKYKLSPHIYPLASTPCYSFIYFLENPNSTFFLEQGQ